MWLLLKYVEAILYFQPEWSIRHSNILQVGIFIRQQAFHTESAWFFLTQLHDIAACHKKNHTINFMMLAYNIQEHSQQKSSWLRGARWRYCYATHVYIFKKVLKIKKNGFLQIHFLEHMCTYI